MFRSAKLVAKVAGATIRDGFWYKNGQYRYRLGQSCDQVMR